MAKIQDGGTINHTEQKTANHISRTNIKTTISVTRKDRGNQIKISKGKFNSKIAKIARKSAKLSWN